MAPYRLPVPSGFSAPSGLSDSCRLRVPSGLRAPSGLRVARGLHVARGLRVACAFILSSAFTCGALAHGEEHSHPPAASSTAVEKTTFGQTGDRKKVTRTIAVDMGDNFRFRPASIAIRKGETIRIVARNTGKLPHEIVIGSPAELQDHAQMMKNFPAMEHEATYMAHVPPGQSREIVWQFTKAGDFKFGCFVAGHFEAGMVGDIVVTPSR